MKNKKSPRRWQAAVIKLIWDTAWDFWQFRNEEAGKQKQQHPDYIRKVNEKIQIQWRLGIPANFEKQYFAGTCTSVLNLTTGQKEDWLFRVQSARELIFKIRTNIR